MGNQELEMWAGGISGFADAYAKTQKEKRDRDAAQSKFAAYMELQREMAGNKTVTGQELFDYGSFIGLKPEDMTALRLDKKYNIELGKAAIQSVLADKLEGKKQTGANEREKIKAGAKKDAASAKGPSDLNKAFKPENASAKALNNALVAAGFPAGTSLSAIGDKVKLEQIGQAYMDEMGGSIQAAGQQDNLEAMSPYQVNETPGTFWGTNTDIVPQPGYRTRVKAAPTASPTPGIAPSVGALPPPGAAPTLAPTREAVGADREALKKRFRKIP